MGKYEPCSRSADSKMILGDFPPSSKETCSMEHVSLKEGVCSHAQDRSLSTSEDGFYTFFKLLFAAASMIFLPVTVDPVNATLSTSGCAAKAAPPIGPRAGMVLITPGGKLVARKYN